MPRTGASAALASGEAAERVDWRLVPLALVVWAVAGFTPVMPRPATYAVIVASALAAVMLLVARSRLAEPGRRSLVAIAAVVALGSAGAAGIAVLHVDAARAGPVPELAAEGAAASVELVVDIDPLPRTMPGGRAEYVSFAATIRQVDAPGMTTAVRTPVIVTGGPEWEQVAPGERVRARGQFALTEPGDRPSAVFRARSSPDVVAPAGRIQQTATDLRFGLRDAVAGLPPAERGLVPGLVVGDVALMPPDLDDDFHTTNLTHLVAVSGSNLTIVLVAVLGGGRWLGARGWVIPLLGLGCVIGFVLVARPEPSVLRAAAMGLVALAGIAAGARRLGVPALAVAVTGLVLIDPWLARTYGFALSVAATAGILVLGPPCMRALTTWLPRGIAAAITVPLVAQLPVLPIVAVLSEAVSVVSVVANLLAGFAVAPATIAGVIATVLAPISLDMAAVAGWVAGLFAWWIIQVGTHGARVPGAELSWPASPGWLIALTAVCAIGAIVLPVILRRRVLSCALAVMLAAWLVHPVAVPPPSTWLTNWPPAGWTMVACDVGQGDGLVLRARDASAIVVDTGIEPGPIDRCLAELGVRHVPYVLLTHLHLDHTGGLDGVLRGRQVDEIAVTPVGLADSPHTEIINQSADAADVVVTTPGAGERRTAGELAWTVLWPPAGRSSVVGDDVGGNDASVVLAVDAGGMRILLTGDIEPPAQAALLRAGADVTADILKVPHHGAATQNPEFLAATGAQLAVIPVGEDNDYGHPAPSTLRLLRDLGMDIVRTDTAGTVAIVVADDGSIEVTRRGD